MAPATAVAGVVSLVVAVTTPPRSGPYCSDGCVVYPYTDAAAYVPRDYLWMYPEMLLTLLFVVLAACLVPSVASERRLLAAIAVCFTVIGATVIAIDYGVQLTVLQPAFLAGETDGLSALSQYNPHGVFIALENIGYAVLGVAFLFLGTALTQGVSRIERAVRWVFTVGGALILAALALCATIYRAELDYRFEVMSLLVTWLVLISAGALLTVAFGRRAHPAATSPSTTDTQSSRSGDDANEGAQARGGETGSPDSHGSAGDSPAGTLSSGTTRGNSPVGSGSVSDSASPGRPAGA